MILPGVNALIVEDSKTSLAAMKLALRQAPGWSFTSAGDGETAMRLCAAIHPDVVLLDLGLPGGGGLELLEAIKSACDVPVVIVSASTYEGSPVTAEALMRGADACFDKARILADTPGLLSQVSQAVDAGRGMPRSAA
jgi:two-component system chemotaxis response regulator CheB